MCEGMSWKVVPICLDQSRDVREEDLLDGGDFRKCDTYRGGGGYDQFPIICKRQLGRKLHKQFVIQLWACTLDCPYCYVTRQGVWGPWKEYTSEQLIEAFKRSGQEVFHLMGGAPAIYLNQWIEIISRLPEGTVFHSDFLLVEHLYQREVLRKFAKIFGLSCLFAVDVKGYSNYEWEKNTRKKPNWDLFWDNFNNLVWEDVPIYITFTAVSEKNQKTFWEDCARRFGMSITTGLMRDSFSIDLIDYNAMPFVDNTTWGKQED